ncbi:MAG: hypothetical protein ACR2QW_03735 [bacterium]
MLASYSSNLRKPFWSLISAIFALILSLGNTYAADIDPFLGEYSGSAEVDNNGSKETRDMSVKIRERKEGFSVEWESTIHKSDGRTKTKTYSIDFVATDRNNIFSSAMKTNVFGHAVPLDPMVGDPYVWSRITGDTLTVFSLHVDEEGGYEMQQYNRTLAEGGLQLHYQRIRSGQIQKTVETFLKRN